MKNSHSSSLFHFTRNFNSLVSIIQEGFRFSYSGEQITRASISGVPPTDNIFVALPMISFCDIPIELCEEHRSKYGDYAIGINKNQLIKHTGGLFHESDMGNLSSISGDAQTHPVSYHSSVMSVSVPAS